MTYTRRTALQLLSTAELELFDASLGKALRAHDEKELKKLVTRARRLRDKARDLLRRQRLETRQRTGAKGGPLGDANRRTEQKAELLDEVLLRLEERQSGFQSPAGKSEGSRPSKKEAAPARKPRAPATKSSKPRASGAVAAEAAQEPASAPIETPARPKGEKRKTSAKGARSGLVPPPATHSGYVNEKAQNARLRRQPVRAQQKAIQAHVKSRGRRNQARRDSR